MTYRSQVIVIFLAFLDLFLRQLREPRDFFLAFTTRVVLDWIFLWVLVEWKVVPVPQNPPRSEPVVPRSDASCSSVTIPIVVLGLEKRELLRRHPALSTSCFSFLFLRLV